MAFQTGVAMGHVDFYNKLLDFLQNDPALVAAGQNWTIVWQNNPNDTNEVILSGPGLAGQDQVLVGFDLVFDVPSLTYELHMYGMTDIIPSSESIVQHVNVSDRVTFFLDASPFTFWFVANGRRLAMVARISTVFQSGYVGLIQPYAQPPSYPYPLFIGGMAGDGTSDADTWRSTSTDHNDYMHAFRSTSSVNFTRSNAYLLDPSGAWRPLAATLSGADSGLVFDSVMAHPYESGPDFITRRAPASEEALTDQISAYGGVFVTQPVTLFNTDPTNQVYGILDGVVATQGINNAAENILTIDGVDFLVVQNAFRVAGHDYHAIALE